MHAKFPRLFAYQENISKFLNPMTDQGRGACPYVELGLSSWWNGGSNAEGHDS